MQTFTLGLCVVVFSLVLAAARFLVISFNEAMSAKRSHTLATDRLARWIYSNAGVAVGFSVEGRNLVLRCIETWEEVLRTNLFYLDNGRTAYFESFLCDFGPLPPGETCISIVPKRLAHASRFSFAELCLLGYYHLYIYAFRERYPRAIFGFF